MTEFNSIRWVSARKPHRCSECKSQIAVGDRYQYQATHYDGEFYTLHMCEPCSDLWALCWKALGWMDAEEGASVGELRNWLREEEDIADPDAWLAEHKARASA